MGTLVGVMGDVSIPKEHWETYAAQMLTVLTQGGMMQYDTIQLYGKNIMLIHKPEFDTDRSVVEWQYNYIENDYWEPCTMDASGWLTTGKVGQNQFRNVMQAAYVLETYALGANAFAHMNGHLFPTDRYVGWLNQILGTEFKMQCVGDIQKVLDIFPPNILRDKYMEFVNIYGERTAPLPAEPVSTADFLHCSPDDLAFLWSPNGKIEFSAAMWKWLSSLKHRLDSLTAVGMELIPPSDFLKTMAIILAEINPSDTLIGNFAWREMFFDWIQAANNLRVQASLVLMKEIASEPSNETQCISNLRRYLAVLGNPSLRGYALGIYIDR